MVYLYLHSILLTKMFWNILFLVFRLESAKMLKVIEDLGLMSDSPIMKAGSPLDTVSSSDLYL